MANYAKSNKDSFLHPKSRYYGKFTPKYLAFNANLQEFSQKVSYIAALQTGGKISAEQAYENVECLWQKLKLSKNAMEIGVESNK